MREIARALNDPHDRATITQSRCIPIMEDNVARPRQYHPTGIRHVVPILTLLVTGCAASIQAYPERPFDAALPILAETDSVRVVQEFYSLRTEAERRTYRDELIAQRIAAIDISYRLFEEQLFQEGTVRNIATDWALLGLAGAGATISSSTTQKILAAVSGGLVGARAAFDKNALFDRTLPSLVMTMEASRDKIQVSLLKGMQVDTSSYGIIDSLGDLDRYYFAGTLPGAIFNIAGNAGVLKEEIQAQRAFSFKSRDEASKDLEEMLKGPSGALDLAKLRQLRSCFPSIGVQPDVLIDPDFLFDSRYALERTKALACMRAAAPVLPPAPQHPVRTGSIQRRVNPADPSVIVISVANPDETTRELTKLLKDPKTGKLSATQGQLARSCYQPAGLDPSVDLESLLNDASFINVRKAIIACMAKSH
jgi:hypothetical protein